VSHVFAQGGIVHSEQLIDRLWPAEDVDAARRRLHVRVSQLRRVLDPDDGEAYIITQTGGYLCWLINSSISCSDGESGMRH